MDIQSEQQEQLEGQILFKILNSKKLMTFSNETVHSLSHALRHASKKLEDGFQYNNTKFYNNEQVIVGFPLASGLPFLFTHQTPSLFRYGGEARLQKESERKEPCIICYKYTLTAEIDGLYTSQVDASAGFTTVFDKQQYTAGIQKKIQVRMPTRMSVNVDLEKSQVKAEFERLDKKDATLLHISSWPYTERKSIEWTSQPAEKDTKLVSVDDEKQFKARIGERSTGMVLDINAQYEKEPLSSHKIMEKIQNYDWSGLAMDVAEYDSNPHFKLEISTNQQKSTTHKLKVQVQVENKESFEDEQHPRNTRSSKTLPWQNEKLESLRQELNKLNGEQQLNNANVRGVQAQIKFVDADGNSKAKFSTNIVHGQSLADNEGRLIFNVQADAAKYNKEFSFRAQTKAPKVSELSLNDALNSQDNGQTNVEMEYGNADDQKKPKMTMRIKAHQTQDRRDEVEQSEDAQECRRQMKRNGDQIQEECRQAIHEAQLYDRYTVNIDYENLSQEHKQFAHSLAQRVLRPLYAAVAVKADVTDDNKNGQGNSGVYFNVQFTPDLQYANITLKTMRYERHYDNIRVPSCFRKYLAIHPEMNPLRRLRSSMTNGDDQREYFIFDSFGIKTFFEDQLRLYALKFI